MSEPESPNQPSKPPSPPDSPGTVEYLKMAHARNAAPTPAREALEETRSIFIYPHLGHVEIEELRPPVGKMFSPFLSNPLRHFSFSCFGCSDGVPHAAPVYFPAHLGRNTRYYSRARPILRLPTTPTLRRPRGQLGSVHLQRGGPEPQCRAAGRRRRRRKRKRRQAPRGRRPGRGSARLVQTKKRERQRWFI